jgi:hypothetical protein
MIKSCATKAIGVFVMLFSASTFGLPITLYDRPLSDPWWDLSDNSGLTKIILTSALLDQSTPWSLKWDITNGNTEVNTYNVHLEWTQGYTKSFSETTDTTVNSELSAEFQGIGAKIGATYSHASTMGIKMTNLFNASIDTVVSLCCLQNAKYYTKAIYDLFSGTFEWFDDVGPHAGGTTRYGTWSSTVNHGHGILGPIKNGCGTCIPEPPVLLLFVPLLAVLASYSRTRGIPRTVRPGEFGLGSWEFGSSGDSLLNSKDQEMQCLTFGKSGENGDRPWPLALRCTCANERAAQADAPCPGTRAVLRRGLEC